MAKVKPIVARTPEELAQILNLPPQRAHSWVIQSALLKKIKDVVKKEKLTHAVLAKRAETSRARVTSILNGNLDEVSTDLLIRILGAAGYRVEVQVTKAKIAA